MERPRNRQPRPPRGNARGGRGGRGGGQHHRSPATPQQAAGTVPTIQQVVPGSGVFIVLKEDQPTGRETRGVVDEVLTSGNHPRGIKVRLRGGQVGRVQRLDKTSSDGGGLASAENSAGLANGGPTRRGGGSTRFSHRYTDVRNDDYLEGPPERSLADFLPPGFGESMAPKQRAAPTATCPVCQDFEGDETAVTHHIDRVHLS